MIPLGGIVRLPGMNRPAARDLRLFVEPAVREEPSLVPAVGAFDALSRRRTTRRRGAPASELEREVSAARADASRETLGRAGAPRGGGGHLSGGVLARRDVEARRRHRRGAAREHRRRVPDPVLRLRAQRRSFAPSQLRGLRGRRAGLRRPPRASSPGDRIVAVNGRPHGLVRRRVASDPVESRRQGDAVGAARRAACGCRPTPHDQGRRPLDLRLPAGGADRPVLDRQSSEHGRIGALGAS